MKIYKANITFTNGKDVRVVYNWSCTDPIDKNALRYIIRHGLYKKREKPGIKAIDSWKVVRIDKLKVLGYNDK